MSEVDSPEIIRKDQPLPNNADDRVDLKELKELVDPVVQMLSSGQEGQAKIRAMEIDAELKMASLFLWPVYGILFFVMVITGFMLVQGDTPSAMSVLSHFAALAAGVLGGYGISRKSK